LAEAIHVGVSGFSYPAWRGRFYPKELKSEELLANYSKRLDCVEINSSFYGAPRHETVENWAAKTGSGFRLAFKAPRLITHIMKLGAGSDEAAGRFYDGLEPLGPRRGPILFQLPPFLKKDTKLLEGFLSGTETVKDRVFEFRNLTWLEESTYSLLQDRGAGFCIAETEDLKPEFRVTSGTAYFRLRKDEYDVKSVDSWAKRIGATAKKADRAYVFLRHDESGENALLAVHLAKKLSE
jgi:uncharacterized protein YecE (DUF72 family)